MTENKNDVNFFEEKRNIAVFSAQELSLKEKTKIEDMFIKKYNSDINFVYELDKSLIGGIMVVDGDSIFDGSIKSQISKIKKLL